MCQSTFGKKIRVSLLRGRVPERLFRKLSAVSTCAAGNPLPVVRALVALGVPLLPDVSPGQNAVEVWVPKAVVSKHLSAVFKKFGSVNLAKPGKFRRC